MHHFDAHDRAQMVAARKQLREILQPLAADIASHTPSFEGFVLFQQDIYHPDSAAAIVQANAPQTPPERLAFQNNHVTNRRVDLRVSTLGETFHGGSYELAESAMNPEHAVAGIHVPAEVGKRAASVFQLAFTKAIGAPTTEELLAIKGYWEHVAADCLPYLDTLHYYASGYPNASVSDALLLDVPTTPNAFIVAWDTSGSRKIAQTDYPRLRDFLTRTGHMYRELAQAGGGQLLRPTGDGQAFVFEIPSRTYNRLSDISIAKFAHDAVVPTVKNMLSHTRGTPPVRFAVGLGRVEHTTFDTSSPVLWELADVLDTLPRNELAVGYTPRVLQCLGLTAEELDKLTAEYIRNRIVIG